MLHGRKALASAPDSRTPKSWYKHDSASSPWFHTRRVARFALTPLAEAFALTPLAEAARVARFALTPLAEAAEAARVARFALTPLAEAALTPLAEADPVGRSGRCVRWHV